MTQKERLPHALVTAMMLLTLLATVGCMTWHQAVTGAAGDIASTIDTSEPKRDAHLCSADFLDVARYPTIAFRSTRIERADGDHWKVTGDLTLLGRTRPVLLDVDSSTSEGTRSSAHATTTIDRRDFGMTYAGFAVGKQVVITIDAAGMNTAADASLE